MTDIIKFLKSEARKMKISEEMIKDEIEKIKKCCIGKLCRNMLEHRR